MSAGDPAAPAAGAPVLTLLTRAYCHLCDDMAAALAPIAARRGARVVAIDIDARPDLEARYGDLVPVLLWGDATNAVELCHYHLDAAAIERAFAERA